MVKRLEMEIVRRLKMVMMLLTKKVTKVKIVELIMTRPNQMKSLTSQKLEMKILSQQFQ